MRAPTILQGTFHYFPGGWVLVLKMLSISRSCQTSSTTQVDPPGLDPPSHHSFQYQVMVVHNLDDLGYPHDLLWMGQRNPKHQLKTVVYTIPLFCWAFHHPNLVVYRISLNHPTVEETSKALPHPKSSIAAPRSHLKRCLSSNPVEI